MPRAIMASVTRRPRLGYALAAAAATMWALNGSLARYLLDDGVSAQHLSELRSGLSFVAIAIGLAITNRERLRVHREDLGRLAWLGIAGLAGVHATYFLAIERLQISVALTIQYLGPVLLLLWLAVVHKRRLKAGLWGAVIVSVVGCFLAVEAYDAGSLVGLGVLAAMAAAITFAIYLVASERAGHRYHPATTLLYGFGFATLFWLVVRPPWTFPFEAFDSTENVLYGLGVAFVGTLIPFLCIVEALRHIPAPRAAIIATLEPVLAALIAWPLHDETLGVPQILGGLLVVGAVIWVQTHQSEVEQESAPAWRAKATPAQADTST
jgi:drug/metabolite transporter (DMT)-like permease